MGLHDILADDKLFDRLLCLIIMGAMAVALVVRSFRNDKEL